MWHPRRDHRFFQFRWTGFMVALLLLVLVLHADAGGPDAEVLPPGVSVRQGPALTAAVVAEFPAGVQVEVLFTQSGPGGSWAQVALPSGGTGFVPEQALRRLTLPLSWTSAGVRSSSPSGQRRSRDDVLEIPLRRVGGVFLVTARINNQVATNFIVDSGASIVTISHALADQLGIDYENTPKQRIATASGFIESPRIVLDSIYVPDEGGVGVPHVEAHVVTLPGSPPIIGGLLGQSFLSHFQVTIDAERAVMRLETLRR